MVLSRKSEVGYGRTADAYDMTLRTVRGIGKLIPGGGVGARGFVQNCQTVAAQPAISRCRVSIVPDVHSG